VTATALSLSDLVLGSRNANLTWRRSEDDTVLFNPLRTYRRSDQMELYYEIEGLRPTPYTVELSVRKKGSSGGLFRKIFGGGGAAIRLKFAEQATTPTVSTHRTLQLQRLKPGNYVLELVVTDSERGRPRGREDQERLHQALGSHHRLNLYQVLGHPGAGIECCDVHQHGRQRPLGGLGAATLGRVHRGARHQRNPRMTKQPQGESLEAIE
jgi:hypothetical protein